jgi:hypothetical protein
MKRPRMGIRSTQRVVAPAPLAVDHPPIDIEVLSKNSFLNDIIRPPNANLIENDDTSSDANIFCFAAFADKQTGILYNDLTGPFPFMSLEGNVCFLIHYKTNTILVLPIKGFTDAIILEAYKQQFNLESKGYKIKLNVMDNQATKVIKQFLDKLECDLLLVEPNTASTQLNMPSKLSKLIL